MISIRSTVRLLACVLAVQGLSISSSAYEREVKVPLSGSDAYYKAGGTAKLVTIWGEAGRLDREDLTIQVKHVPLPPGTVLVVNVGEHTVGHLVLDARQSGILKISAEGRKSVLRLTYGTTILLTTIDGKNVMQ